MEEKQRHFVLVHGSCHGAWCWYKVCSSAVQELQSISDYFESLMKFMMSLPAEERVILVDHGFGGLSVSIAMGRFPEKISAGVFVAAIMPGPDFTYTTAREEVVNYLYWKYMPYARRIDTYMDTQYTYDDGPNNPPTSLPFGPNCITVSQADLILGMMLIRPNRLYSNAAIQIEAELTKERHGSVPRIYVVCGQDNIVKEDLQRWMIQENPPDEVKLISDSDHMVMFSKPQELCSYLKEIANKYF
ncbi:hypothetical protein P3X46_033984 [Hevea brasiliensis]|uniref:AB hydrolase-1 domain-containing protein n=1 Tax=Hevea brasiliensis TaxID=3981 RepID=A0ABQ9KC79_HEVBR|nr:hypothetical protein P3X46_033984 [Hevea brasiliensis]